MSECKRMRDKRWGRQVSQSFNEKRKLFWKKLNKVQKPKEKVDTRITETNGRLVMNTHELQERWKEYLDELLTVPEDRELVLSTLESRAIRKKYRENGNLSVRKK